tara:strand:- start:3461 stop:4699 length:1239 start_codon:yes stop_codon:yes gene_type:complete
MRRNRLRGPAARGKLREGPRRIPLARPTPASVRPIATIPRHVPRGEPLVAPRYTLRYKLSVRGIEVFQAVFAFIMALGLGEVFTGSYHFLTTVLFSPDQTNSEKLLFLLVFFNIVLLGIRFFWVPRNFRLLVHETVRHHPEMHDLSPLQHYEISIHWFIVLLHAMLFYLIGSEFEHIGFLMLSSKPFSQSALYGFFTMQIVLLLLNSAWIAAIEYRKRDFARRTDNAAISLKPPGSILWMRNNLACVLLTLGPLAIGSTCPAATGHCLVIAEAQSSAGCVMADGGAARAGKVECIDDLPSLTGAGLAPSPTSPAIIANASSLLFETVFAALDPSDADRMIYWPALWILIIFLVNSLLDLLNTGKFYLMLEEVEWDVDYSGTAPAAAPRRRGRHALRTRPPSPGSETGEPDRE